jgi:dTDP-4-amino-4,6-dideoxygalactose transaminase
MNKHAIYVTQPSMPPLNEFVNLLDDIWKSKWITNNGKYHQLLEEALAQYLNVKYISLFTNGTLALITALQTLRITGEVITTPYSFVATTHALHWNGIKPVFVDIEPVTLNLNPDKIESAITPRTTAILPVHVYGNPCSVNQIQKIADTYGLKVIYDACHTFGVKLNENPILDFGDLSVLSFHATKVYNTIEGGAIVCHDEKTKKRIDYLKNFGFADEVTVVSPGINAKMNEIQAAYGILQLKYIDENIAKRREISCHYKKNFENVNGIKLIPEQKNVKLCYAYFPIFIDSLKFGKTRDEVYEDLKKSNIFGRRYFYPLITHFSTYGGLSSASAENLPVAEKATREVLCLPIYPELTIENVNNIIKIVLRK